MSEDGSKLIQFANGFTADVCNQEGVLWLKNETIGFIAGLILDEGAAVTFDEEKAEFTLTSPCTIVLGFPATKMQAERLARESGAIFQTEADLLRENYPEIEQMALDVPDRGEQKNLAPGFSFSDAIGEINVSYP